MPRPRASSAPTTPLEALAAFSPVLPLAVAYSGGADSTAMLLACVRRWPGQVAAIHVHHGLQAAADAFASHCELRCTALGVPLAVCRVQARHARGQSPEDAARQARYGALARAMASPIGALACRSLVLAHHADDQVETLLLALSRGAGLPGLAAMPAYWMQDGIGYHRPWLALPGAVIRAWLADIGEAFVEDPSNRDEAFTRNRIRARLLPVLQQTFPQFRSSFARSARHAAQAQELLHELAAADLERAGGGPGLPLAGLRALGRARQANLLRHWLQVCHATVATAAQLEALLEQVGRCATRGHDIRLKVGRGFACREGRMLAWYNAAAVPPPSPGA